MIKFKRLTIALAALLITSATAWAQTEQTVAVTPVTGQTNQWTLTMPAANVTLNVEYAPEFTATFKALTANTIQAGKATVTLTDNTQGATAQSAPPDADGKLTPVYEGQTITLTAQTGYKFRSVTATKGEAAVTAATPLTMECLSDGTIVVNIDGALETGMQYAVNGGTKTTITETTTIDGLKTGDKVQFYGVGTSTQDYGNNPQVMITDGTAQVKVYGNIMSLVDETGFATKTALPSSAYVFKCLFYDNANLTDASGLLLPAETLTEGCYFQMFYGCSALTAAPALPATKLADYCYAQMFYGCTALTAAPELKAETLYDYCYSGMFISCTALTAAPALPATTLTEGCYMSMFAYCTALTAAPELKAETLAENCYFGMFNGCSKLASVTCKATDISAEDCLTNWLYGAGTDASVTSPTLYVTDTSKGWNNAGFTVKAIPGN